MLYDEPPDKIRVLFIANRRVIKELKIRPFADDGFQAGAVQGVQKEIPLLLVKIIQPQIDFRQRQVVGDGIDAAGFMGAGRCFPSKSTTVA